jgi:hypothetical protein
MMAEHRVRSGDWVLPGSGYVELIRAAVREVSPETPFSAAELVFFKPFTVKADSSRELEVRLTPNAHMWDVSVLGRVDRAGWTEHATATVGTTAFTNDTYEALSTVLGRLGEPKPESRPPHPVMDFGPRWGNITAVSTLNTEALLRHSLPGEFTDDFETVDLHPALLDMATAGAQHLIPGVDTTADFFVPAGYGNLQMRGRLDGTLTSHVRLRSAEQGSLASFDVTVYGDDGSVLVDVRDFSMIRVPKDALAREDSDEGPRWLRDAISPGEGRDVLRRLLTHNTGPHVLIATRPLGDLIAEAARALAQRARSGQARRASSREPILEVAEALMAHDAVREAAAVGSRTEGEPARVVAFVAYHAGRHATVTELRRFARERVDRDLVPQNFVEMVALPRMEGGRVAFEELRDPFAAVDDHTPPRTETEKTIASIWAELLGLDRVGIHDNFLDVGGHSLVGIRVLLRIKQATGARVEANALTMQTLEQLAADVDRINGGPSAGAPVPQEGSVPPPTSGDAEDSGNENTGLMSRVRKAIAGR